MWTGTVYMGSQSTPMDVIFDNASDWLTIEGKDCSDCQGNTFDIAASDTATRLDADNFS